MSIFKVHLHTVQNTYSESIRIIVALIFVVTFVLCSVTFSIVHSFVKDTQGQLERTFGVRIAWSGMYFHPWRPKGDVSIFSLRFSDEKTKEDIVSAKTVFVGFRIRAYATQVLQTLVGHSATEDVSAVRPVYFLSSLLIRNGLLNYREDYQSFYTTVNERLFALKQLPHDATILIEDSRLDVLISDYAIVSEDVMFKARLIKETTSIIFDIDSGLTLSSTNPAILSALRRGVNVDIVAHVSTSNFFEDSAIEARLSNAHIEDVVTLRPLFVASTVGPQHLDVSVYRQNQRIFEGTFDRKKNIGMTKVSVENMPMHALFDFSEEAQDVVSALTDDVFSAQGEFVYDGSTATMQYTFDMRNAPMRAVSNGTRVSERAVVRIDVYGDEEELHARDITIKLGKDFFSWQGSLALKSLAPHGTVKFIRESFLMNKSLQSVLVLRRTGDIVHGNVNSLIVGGIVQPYFFFTYNAVQKYIHVFLSKGKKPIISLFKDEGVGRWHITLEDVPVQLAAVLLPTVGKRYFDASLGEVTAQGKITVYPTSNSAVSAAEYSIEFLSPQGTAFYVRISGIYSEGVWNVREALVSLPAFYETRIKARGFYDSNALKLDAFVNVKHAQVDKEFEYSIVGSMDSTNNDVPKWVLSVNKNAMVFLENWQSNAGRKRVKFQVKDFALPSNDLWIENASIDAVYAKKAITHLDGTVHIGARNVRRFLKTKFRLIDEVLQVSSFHVSSSKKAIKARGKIEKKDGLWHMALRTYPSRSEQVLKDNDEGNTIISGRYDGRQNMAYLSLRGIDAELFSSTISGLVNLDAFAVSDLSRYGITLQESTLIVNNVPMTILGSLEYEKDSISLYDVFLMRNEMQFHMPKVVLQNLKEIVGTYNISSQSNVYALVRGAFDITAAQALHYESIKNGIMPEFKGTVISEVEYTHSDMPKSVQYTYTAMMENTSTMFSIVEEENKFFLSKEKGGSLNARIGGFLYPFHIVLDGNVTERDIHVNLRVLKADFAPLLRKVSPSKNAVKTLEIRGNVSIRGTKESPKYYGFLEGVDTEFRIPVFSKALAIPRIMVLFSENTISIGNTKVVIGSGHVNMAAKAQLVNYRVRDLTLTMRVDERSSIRAKKFSIGKVNITGTLHGLLSITMHSPSTLVEIVGDVYLSNTDVVFEGGQKVTYNSKLVERLSVNVTTYSKRGVVFIMPSINFPILRGYLGNAQKLHFVYEGSSQTLRTMGNIEIQGGQVYYFNKDFTIADGLIIFDEKNPISNPYVAHVTAQRSEYYKGERHMLQLRSENTKLLNMDVDITASPFLSPAEIASIIGNEDQYTTREDSLEEHSDSGKFLTGLVGLSDPLSNIGIFSRFEQLLRRSLQLDYISFNTKIARRLLEYSLDRETAFRQGLNSNDFLDAIPYFFTGSSLEIGKYVKDLYVSFALTVNNNSLFVNAENQNTMSTVGINTVFNVELPTPVFNLRWSFDPTLFFNRVEVLPVSFLTILYELQY